MNYAAFYLACVAGGIVFARVVLAAKPPARENDPAGYAGYVLLGNKFVPTRYYKPLI